MSKEVLTDISRITALFDANRANPSAVAVNLLDMLNQILVRESLLLAVRTFKITRLILVLVLSTEWEVLGVWGIRLALRLLKCRVCYRYVSRKDGDLRFQEIALGIIQICLVWLDGHRILHWSIISLRFSTKLWDIETLTLTLRGLFWNLLI